MTPECIDSLKALRKTPPQRSVFEFFAFLLSSKQMGAHMKSLLDCLHRFGGGN